MTTPPPPVLINPNSIPPAILSGLHTSLGHSPEGKKLLAAAAADPSSGIRAIGPLSGSPDRATGTLRLLAPYLAVLSGEAGEQTDFAKWVLAKKVWFLTLKDADLNALAHWPRIARIGIQQSRLGAAAIPNLAAALPDLRELSIDTFSDAIGAALPLLQKLEDLDIGEQMRFGDPHIAHLLALPRLKSVRLHKCAVTPAGYKQLAGHPTLETIHLYAADDDTLVAMAGAPSMKHIRIVLAKVTDAGLAQMAKIAGNLESLELTRAGKVTDAGVAALSALGNLRVLNLSSSKLTDRSAAVLAGFKKLVELDIGGTRLTDKSVPIVCTLNGLQMLRVTGTKISPQGLGQLGKALPKCNLVTLG